MKILQKMAVAASLTMASFSASAIPVFYNDVTSFLGSAGGGLGFESYENAPNSTSDTYNFAGFSVSETNGINILTNVAINGAFGNVPVTDGVNAIWYDDNNGSLSNFFSFAGGVNAFGLYVSTSEASTLTITGSSFNTSINLAANTPTFFGVIDSTVANFAPIQFDASGGPLVGFDETYFGKVPEPAMLSLLGLGLLMLGFRRHRV